MGLKGIVFTTDVLIGMGLVFALLLLIPLRTDLNYHDISFQSLSYESNDLINILATMKARSFLSTPTISNLYANKIITTEDLNKTMLDFIGSFWYSGNATIASNVTKDILGNLSSKCFSLQTQNATIFSSCNSTSDTVSVAYRMVSGYQVGMPVSGYIARAWIIKAIKNNTLISKSDTISSSVKAPNGANNQNRINISYDISIPANSTLLDSLWFIETSWTDNVFRAFINGVYVPGSDGTGSITLTNLLSYLHPGYNAVTVECRFGNSGPEAGEDGAGHFIVNYSTDQQNTLPQTNRIYFAKVVSNASIRYEKPIFIAGNISGVAVNISATGTNATLNFTFNGQSYKISTKNLTGSNAYWNESEIRNAFNSKGIYYSNLSSIYFWFVVDIDAYSTQQSSGSRRTIFNTSYVEVNFTQNILTYGKIDMTKRIPVSSYSNSDTQNFYNDIVWKFNFTGNPLDLDSQLAWLYHSGSNPSQKAAANALILYQHPPSPLITEFARYGYTNTRGEIVNGMNNYTLDFGSGYSVDPFDSLVDYTFLVPSQVGYGNVFNTSSLAVNDAKQRLTTLLNAAGISVQSQDISVDYESVQGIMWLWGPSMFKILSWGQ
jgi:hypothetical protein